MSEPLVINEWQNGIADSPHVGFGLMKMADIESFPGAVKVRAKTTSLFPTALSTTFTADNTTEIMTIVGTLPITGTAVTVSNSGGALPVGLTAGTIYFIINVSATTFKLATTLANAFSNTPINITSNGTGTQTVTTVNPGTINHIIVNQRTNVFVYIAQDSNGRVWYYDPSGSQQFFLMPGNTLTSAAGNGIALFLPSDNNSTFLFVFRNTAIDVCDVFSLNNMQNPSWTNGWKTTLTSSASHYAKLGQDNVLYFCNAQNVGSITETPGDVFDPSDAVSYTFNISALDLPLNESSQHLEELGANLLVAGNTFNKIYPWDRTSDSFNLPIDVPEVGIKKLKNIGGVVYILAGTKGNIYSTTGTYVTFEKKIPDYVSNNSGTLQATVVTWGGIDARNGSLLFGAGVLTSGNSGAFMIQSDGKLVLDNIPSTGSANVTALFAQNEFYILGYAGGADKVDTTRYSSFQTVVHSDFKKVATKTEKATYSNLEVLVAKPAVTGNMRISYRTDTSSSFTTLDTYTADSTNVTFETDIGLINIENIQIQVEMDGDFELVEIRLIP